MPLPTLASQRKSLVIHWLAFELPLIALKPTSRSWDQCFQERVYASTMAWAMENMELCWWNSGGSDQKSECLALCVVTLEVSAQKLLKQQQRIQRIQQIQQIQQIQISQALYLNLDTLGLLASGRTWSSNMPERSRTDHPQVHKHLSVAVAFRYNKIRFWKHL